MMKTPIFKQNKTCLTDLISTMAPTKSSMFEKPPPFNQNQQPDPKPSPSIPIVYDDFIYTDKLTKRRIKMIDAKLSYQTGRKARKSFSSSANHNTLNHEKKKKSSRFAKHNSQSQFEKQLSDLNECFFMLKSTEMFKLNSLRQKIFKSIDRSSKQTPIETPKAGCSAQNIHGEIKNMIKKKKKIRQILQDSVKQANITQFRKYFSDENHKLNNKILEMNKQMPKSFNKSNVQKIIERLVDAEKQDQSVCNFNKKEDDEIEFPGQQKLRTELIQHMKKLIRHNGQYLVTPEKKKLLYERLYKNTVLKINDFSNKEQDETLAHAQTQFEPINQDSFMDEKASSKANIDVPTEKSILKPIVNQHAFIKKQNVWTKSLSKSSKLNGQKQKKRTEYPCIGQQRKQKHKKQNSCINLTNNLKLKPKESFRLSNQISYFLNNFTFNPCQKNKEISMIKKKFQRNNKLNTTKLSLKQQKFLFMVENGLLFDVEKQILMNEEYLFMKDKNENNLLQICAKNHSTQMFTFIVERYTKCGLKEEMREKWGQQILKDRLIQKNKHNKNVFEVARLYHAQEIILQLAKFKQGMNIREQNS